MYDALIDGLRDPELNKKPGDPSAWDLLKGLWGDAAPSLKDAVIAARMGWRKASEHLGIPSAFQPETATGQLAKDIGQGQGDVVMAVAGGPAIKAPRATSVNLPSLRGLPRDEAVALAQGEPHLIKGGAGTEGYYVGGPRNMKGPEDL